jgi:hypothetical protein
MDMVCSIANARAQRGVYAHLHEDLRMRLRLQVASSTLVIVCLCACEDAQDSSSPRTADAGRPAAEPAPVSEVQRADASEPAAAGCASFDSSFAAIQALVFERHGCTASQCHGEERAGKLDLRAEQAYESLVDARASAADMARVQPGTVNESALYLKLKAATSPGSVSIYGSPMPVGAAPLSEAELAAVELWILKGAPKTGVAADLATGKDVGSFLDACLPEPKPILVKPLEEPARDEGVQLLLPSYQLQARSEAQNCTAFAYDFTDKVPERYRSGARNVIYVNGSRVRQDPQSHHLVLYNPGVSLEDLADDIRGWTCREGGRAGESCDPRRGSKDCGSQGVCAGETAQALACGAGGVPTKKDAVKTMLAEGLSSQLANTQSPQEYIPPQAGVYWEIPLKGVLMFNSHAFNLTDEDTTLHARVNFYYTDDLQRKLVPVNVTANNYIAAGQAPFTRETYCAKHVVPRGNSLTILTGHTHRHGERFWVKNAQSELIYENFVYNDPLYKRFDPWLTFDAESDAARTLEYCATYNNGLKEDGSPDLNLVTRASRMPEGTSCKPVACVAGKIEASCSTDADCDSSPEAHDGVCDACEITRGTTTENEMFVLMPWYALPRAR